MDELTMAYVYHMPATERDPKCCPKVEFPWASYKEFWQPWRRALILKVLGKSFSYRVLEPRIKKMWQLDQGCEIIDLDKGYQVARVYSGEDYLKVL